MAKQLKDKAKGGDTSGTIVLMLGLYLILLAFFILLNAISEVAIDKFERASQSIASGFGFRAAQTVIKDDPDEALVNEFYEKIADDIQEVFSAYISNSQFEVESTRDTMIVRLRAHAFFDEGEWKIISSQASFFTDLADLLNEKRPGARIILDIRVPSSIEEAPDPVELNGLRASQFARALDERGVNSNFVTSAVTEQEGDRIVLLFTTQIIDRVAVVAQARVDSKGGK